MTEIRLLGAEELPACLALERDRDWGTDVAKWRLMFETGDVYAVDAPDGDGLAGCVVVTRYGDNLAAVGMMLVATRYGRQGLGTTLMRHTLEATQGRIVELTATRFGRPVYERLGFVVTGGLTVHTGSLRVRDTTGFTGGDPAEVLALDAQVIGGDRSKVLTRLMGLADRVVVGGGGYAIAWNAGEQRVIGPITAPTEQVARDLIVAAAAGADRELRVDVLGAYPGLRSWLREQGMSGGDNELPTMVYGAQQPPGDRSRYVSPILISWADRDEFPVLAGL